MKTEPVILLAAVAAFVVNLAATFGVVLETGVIETLLLNVVIIVTALVQRSKVLPAGRPT